MCASKWFFKAVFARQTLAPCPWRNEYLNFFILFFFFKFFFREISGDTRQAWTLGHFHVYIFDRDSGKMEQKLGGLKECQKVPDRSDPQLGRGCVLLEHMCLLLGMWLYFHQKNFKKQVCSTIQCYLHIPYKWRFYSPRAFNLATHLL